MYRWYVRSRYAMELKIAGFVGLLLGLLAGIPLGMTYAAYLLDKP